LAASALTRNVIRGIFAMNETWLKPNRRALCFACVPPLVLGMLGGWTAFAASEAATPWRRSLGMAMIVVAAVLLAMLVRQLLRPRIAYRNGHVLFYLRSRGPIAVPAEVVEAFFLGQGPANLPGGVHNDQKTINLVARLAQRQLEWANMDVKQALGNWSDGYVTIRGTWCEPLNPELVRRLNCRLKEVKAADNGASDQQ
jgi:hypothetical protein